MLFRSAIFPLAADQQIPSTTRAKETIVLQKGRLYFKLFYLLQIAFEYTQSIVIKMIAEIPALNIIVSFLYISLAGASMFLLKLSSKTQHLPPSNQSLPRQQQSLKVYGRVAVSWLKKYSIIGAGMHADKKYLAKELLLLSVYGVACLKINKITLWPVALATFLLPSFFFMHEIAFKLQRNSQRATEKTCADELQIAVQSQNIEGTQVVSTHQQATNTRKAKQLKSTIEIVAISMIAFVAVVLDFQAAMVMAKSISNSGELNLVSVLCIVLLDQLILRPFSGLLFVAIIKFLEYKQIISIHQNKLIVFLCEQQLQEQQLLQERKRAKAALESTQNHLKQRQEEQHDTSVPIKPGNPHMAYIDFQHMQPEANQNVSSPHHAFSHSSKQVVDQQEVYLTTPEKELFEADIFSNNHETIVNTYLRNKQNTENLSNASQITYQPNHKKEVNCFEELILTKEHEQPLRSLQNLEPSFQNQTEAEEKRKKGENKRKNQRVLKLTGNSPYLQYLPNMLKNVRKAQTLGVPATPKLAQLNLR